MNWTNKRILITGGTGSIGRVLTEILLKEYNPQKITLFSHSEINQYKTMHYFKERGLFKSNIFSEEYEDKIKFRIGDIADERAVYQSMINADIVIHLAAMKHISLCEDNPDEAIKVNIEGTKNIYRSAMELELEVCLFMSTDKAYGVPISLYGYTKAIGEKLFMIAAEKNRTILLFKKGPTPIEYNGVSLGDAIDYKIDAHDDDKTKFCIVRAGNILDSTGSVTELWRRQIEKDKAITITDPNMTRFFISLPGIARFIIQSIENTQGGELFIPKMKACSIDELADALIDGRKIVKRVIGKSSNEKMHEALNDDMRSDDPWYQMSFHRIKEMLKENEAYL